MEPPACRLGLEASGYHQSDAELEASYAPQGGATTRTGADLARFAEV